jgi:hypothetical protein
LPFAVPVHALAELDFFSCWALPAGISLAERLETVLLQDGCHLFAEAKKWQDRFAMQQRL